MRLLVDGDEVRLGAPKQQAMLAILALNANTVVSKQTLVDGIWGEDVPATAVGNVYTYLSNLRNALSGSQIELVRASGGYRLQFDPELLDVSQVLQLIEQQQALRAEPEKALASAEQALGYWRSTETLTGVPGPFAEQRRTEFGRLRQRLVASRAGLCLELRRPEAAVDQLVLEMAHHPYDEQLAALLITALSAAGRPGEALSFFGEFRDRLVDELGVEPGAEVQQACGQLTMAGRSTRAASGATFVGRAAEIDAVLAVASLAGVAPANAGRSMAPVVAVVGVGGIGKTAFVAECTRQLADRFADGQLKVDLNGFGLNSAPVTKHEALHALLSALGHDRIPADYEARLTRYRDALRTSQYLVILDNAADASVVADLIDVGRANFVMVTSRDRLTALTIAPHVHRITLPRLSPLEARTLLASMIGRERLGGHRSDLTRLSRLCDHLPLALRITAQQINSRPGLDVSGLVDEFAHAARRLDLLEVDNNTNSVRAAFQWSYARLGPAAARLLRLLASLPCDRFTPPLAAAVADLPLAETDQAIHSLLDHHLLDQVDDALTMHDLTRACAIEILEQRDTPQSRDDAITRATIWFIASLREADNLMGVPTWYETPSFANCVPQPYVSADRFIAWMDVQARAVTALIPAVHKAGHPDYAWKLAILTYSYFYTSGRLTGWVDVLEAGLAAAEACGERRGQASVLNMLGVAHSRAGNNDLAIRSYEEAHALLADDDLRGRSSVLVNLASTLREAGRYEEALVVAADALRLSESSGSRYCRLGALDAICEIYAETGEAELAVARAQEALTSGETDALVPLEANLLISLGTARRTLEELGPARTAFRRALAIAQGQGDRYHEALAEFGLARTELASGNADLARTIAERARQHFRELAAEEESAVSEFLAQTRPGNSGPDKDA